MEIVHFAPLPWAELQKNGYRKTSGAMLKALWERTDVERIWYVQHDQRWGWRVQKTVVDSKLTVIGLPIGLPYERFAPIRQINRRWQARLLKQSVLSRTNIIKLIYWFYDWWNVELISHLPRTRTVMELTDLASHFINQNRQTTQQEHLNQVKLLSFQIVDYFFPVSTALESECVGSRGKVTVLPNGIGSDFLEQARQPQPEPIELQGIPHPRLCVVSTGWSLNYRLDHELLIESLNTLSDWHLIIIGCEKVETPALKKLTQHHQVKTIGLVPLETLPAYIQYCDVCAVPYRQEAENSGDRLKIYEYLACGKLVLLSVNEGQESIRHYLHYAFNVNHFVIACQKLLNSPLTQVDDLNKLLDEMTWDKRAQTCLSVIENIAEEAAI